MDLLTDDINETLMDENIITPDCFDDRLNIGEDDDLIKDPEDDQRIDEELNREIEQANTIANEPEDIYNTDDEDTGINDSGFDENSTPDHIQESPTINST
ncbi:unnamed protein product, partial [Rotaria sordida]